MMGIIGLFRRRTLNVRLAACRVKLQTSSRLTSVSAGQNETAGIGRMHSFAVAPIGAIGRDTRFPSAYADGRQLSPPCG